jgi:hypothetical protein
MKRILLITILIAFVIQTKISFSQNAQEVQFLKKFQEQQLNYCYQKFFRVGDLYRSAPYVHNEADIAVTGFCLAALPIAVEHKLIKLEKASQMALATIERCLRLQAEPKQNFVGFLYHYYIWNDSQEKFHHKSGVEVSTIDTAILVSGMITSGEYFAKKGILEVREKAMEFYSNINWRKFFDDDRGLFHMAWRRRKFFGWWDFYSDEILLIALLASSSPEPTHGVELEEAMQGWKVKEGNYEGREYVYSWYGSLFTYLYAHAFIDFKRLGRDSFHGVDWWQNSKNAILADIKWCKENGYPEDVWGLSASWSRKLPDTSQMEYRWRIGSALCGAWDRIDNEKNNIKPIAPYAGISCLPFFSDLPLEENPAFKLLKKIYPNAVNQNGLLIESLDANKLSKNGIPQVNSNYTVGSDIIFPTLMIENYFSELVWNNFTSNFFIKITLYRTFPESYAYLVKSR